MSALTRGAPLFSKGEGSYSGVNAHRPNLTALRLVVNALSLGLTALRLAVNALRSSLSALRLAVNALRLSLNTLNYYSPLFYFDTNPY